MRVNASVYISKLNKSDNQFVTLKTNARLHSTIFDVISLFEFVTPGWSGTIATMKTENTKIIN